MAMTVSELTALAFMGRRGASSNIFQRPRQPFAVGLNLLKCFESFSVLFMPKFASIMSRVMFASDLRLHFRQLGTDAGKLIANTRASPSRATTTLTGNVRIRH